MPKIIAMHHDNESAAVRIWTPLTVGIGVFVAVIAKSGGGHRIEGGGVPPRPL